MIQLKSISLCFFLCLFLLACGQKAKDKPLTPSQKETLQQLQKKADTYLIRDESIREFFAFTNKGLEMYASAEDKANQKAEFTLSWEEMEDFKITLPRLTYTEGLEFYKHKGNTQLEVGYSDSLAPPLPKILSQFSDSITPLKGIKIALDPGHLGGDMEAAELEKKYMKLKKGEIPGYDKEVAFNEGNHALSTALLLKKRLAAAGAQIILTRDQYGKGAMGITFQQWLSEDFPAAFERYVKEKKISSKDQEWWKTEATESDIFRIIYKREDFKVRAKTINDFQPHLTLILHYNIEESNEAEKDGYLKPVPHNYSMAFVPGSFMKGELDSIDWRYDFVRLLMGNEIESSIEASRHVVNAYEVLLNVPAIQEEKGLKYLEKASLKTEVPGVYARNLSMTRMIKGPLVFGEALLQDNYEEAIRLNELDYTEDTIVTSSRINEAADAYYQAVLAWAKERK